MREVLNGWLCFNPKSSTPQRTKCNEEYMTLLPTVPVPVGASTLWICCLKMLFVLHEPWDADADCYLQQRRFLAGF